MVRSFKSFKSIKRCTWRASFLISKEQSASLSLPVKWITNSNSVMLVFNPSLLGETRYAVYGLATNHLPNELVELKIISAKQEIWEDWEWREDCEKVASKSSTARLSSLEGLLRESSVAPTLSDSRGTSMIGGRTEETAANFEGMRSPFFVLNCYSFT